MKKYILPLLCLSTPLLGLPPTPPPIDAWFTGPLICPSYQAVPKGEYDIEPYLYFQNNTGNYNAHWSTVSQDNLLKISSYTLIQLGLTDYFNVSLSPQYFYQSQNNSSYTNIGDLPLIVYFQLITDVPTNALPGVVFELKANIPLGRYRNLSPSKAAVQAIGSGSWEPSAVIVLGKQYHFSKYHFLTVRGAFSPQFRNKVSVKGFHAYGGGYSTRGTITLGAQYGSVVSIEYSFTRHLVFAMDNAWQHNNKITFKGKQGLTATGQSAVNTSPSSDQFSLAPALEYNFNENIGLIAGVWVTVAGRNAEAFWCPTIAFNAEY